MSVYRNILLFCLLLGCLNKAETSFAEENNSKELLSYVKKGALAGLGVGTVLGVVDVIKPLWLGPLAARQSIYMHNNMLAWHSLIGGFSQHFGHFAPFLSTGPGSLLMRAAGNVRPGVLSLRDITSISVLGPSSYYIFSLAIDTALLGALSGAALWGTKTLWEALPKKNISLKKQAFKQHWQYIKTSFKKVGS